MNTAQDITITEGRARKALDDTISEFAMPKIKEHVKNTVENERIRTGVITKFYPYLDKAEVRLDETKKLVLCKILHRFGGDMIDFYTPLESEKIFDEKLREPAIIPRATQHVCVLQIHDSDSDENLILGYYQNEEIVGFDPAEPGNVKLMALTETNPYWIKFGRDGIDIRSPSLFSAEVGDLDENMASVEYINSENGYTKEQIDEMIGDAGGFSVGSFSINNEGHLIVEVPTGMSNPYSIDDNGHLIYNTSVGG